MRSKAIQRFEIGVWAALLACVLTIVGIIGCRTVGKHNDKKNGGEQPPPTLAQDSCGKIALRRDWSAFPATLNMKNFAGVLYAIGDVHGDYNDFKNLLVSAKVVRFTGPLATDFEWIAGPSVLVQVGDLINKGDDSVDVLKLAMALETKAKEAGGAAYFLAGNHEIGFIAAPFDPKFEALRTELANKKMGPCSGDFSPNESMGNWLRNRPAAMIVNGMYFSHSGWSQKRSLAEIGIQYEKFIDTNNWDNEFSCGNHTSNPATEGFFNSEAWWGNEGEQFQPALEALGVQQIVFGHDPNAFGLRGQAGGVFGNEQGRALVKIDAGMWQGDSTGVLLRCSAWLENGGCAKLETKSFETPEFLPLHIQQGVPANKKMKLPRTGC